MNTTKIKTKIFIIHGPNINLIGHRSLPNNPTLDKINKYLRQEAKKYGFILNILQTNIEGKAITALQRHRNKISGIILLPGPWQKSGYALKDTLDLIAKPYITISTGENIKILKGIYNIKEKNIQKSCKIAINRLSELL